MVGEVVDFSTSDMFDEAWIKGCEEDEKKWLNVELCDRQAEEIVDEEERDERSRKL